MQCEWKFGLGGWEWKFGEWFTRYTHVIGNNITTLEYCSSIILLVEYNAY